MSTAEEFMRRIQGEMGVLNAEYLVNDSPLKIKVEDSASGDAKISGEIEIGGGEKQRFNPMQTWMKAGEVLDSVWGDMPSYNSMINQNYQADDDMYGTNDIPPNFTPSPSPVLNQGMQYGTPEDYGVTQEVTDRSGVPSIPYQGMDYGTSADYGVTNPPPISNPRVYPNQIGPENPAVFQGNMPYDFTGGLPNAFEGDPPPTTAYGPPPLSGGIQEPLANYPPPGYPSDIPAADGYRTPPNTAMPGYDPGPTAAEGQDAQVSAVENDWNATMDQGGANPADVAKQDAVIKTSAQQNDGSSTVGGKPAADDPAMQQAWGALAYDPAKRKEEYTKKMNTIFMQAMLLDVAANAMGVPSRANAFMDHSMKVLQEQMKFDDQERLYRITQGVFYPGGVYDPPQTQREGFERAMALGATAEEAAAISGYMPEGQVGYDTYYKAQPDGSVQTIYVPKGQAPPVGATDASGIATHNADLNKPATDDDPTAIQIERQVNEWRTEAEGLRAAGDIAGAEALEARADNLLKLGGGSSTTNEYSYAQANSTFNSTYGKMMSTAAEYGPDADNSYRDTEGNFIPWDEFRYEWLTSPDYEIRIIGRDGTERGVPTWTAIQAGAMMRDQLPPTPTSDTPEDTAGLVATDADIKKLRENPTPQMIKFFIEAFGIDQLPEEFK